MLFPEEERTRTQDLAAVGEVAGQFYWERADALFSCSEFSASPAVAIAPQRRQTIDLDTPHDWLFAEIAYKVHLESCGSDGC